MDSGTLTLVDSNPDAIHKFVKEATGLWTLNENAGTEIVKGGVITGGIGREHSFSSVYGSISENGGGVFINQDASFVMEGGNIVGCSAVGEHNTAGGVLVARSASFVMKAGKIAGCTAARGGGVYVADRDGDYALGSFTMNGGTIRNCTAAYGYGGGISSLRNITICGDAFVRDCTASQDKSSAMYLNPSNPADRAVIEGGTFRGNIYASPYCTGMVAVTGGTFDPGQPNGITLYTVTFNSNGGSDVPGQIRANAAATKPADPTRSGYDFGGWYTDEAFTTEYTFTESEKVTQALTLYAKWTKEAAKYYYYSPADGSADTAKGSPKTFDAGVSVYVGMAVLSLSGSAVVLGKKRK